MKKTFFLFFAFLLAASSARSDEIAADVFIDFETSTDGTTITTSILNASTHGTPGTGWATISDPPNGTTGAVPNMIIATAASRALHTPVRVGGVLYDGSPNTRGMEVTMANGGENCIRIQFSPGVNPTSIGFNLRWTGAKINDSPRDVVAMRSDPSGGFQVLQLYDGTVPYYHAHWQPPFTMTGNNVSIAKNQWYWVTMQHVAGGNTFRVSFYNADTFTLVGTSSGTVTTTTTGATAIYFGTYRYNAGSAQKIQYDNLVIKQNGPFPLGPGAGGTVDPMLPDDRQIDWVNTGINGGIPNRSTVGQTINPSFGNDLTDARNEIQTKLNATPSGQVCEIPVGTYRINGQITLPSNVTLRGNGIGNTILKGVGTVAGPLIAIGTSGPSGPNNSGAHTTISSGATRGSTSFVVASASGISTGRLMIISETNNASYPVSNDGTINSPATWVDGDSSGNRARGQIVKVTNVSGTTISFSPALYCTYTNTPWATPFTASCVNSGIENFTIYAVLGAGTEEAWHMRAADQCWIKNIYDDFAEGDHGNIDWSYRCEVNGFWGFDGFMHADPFNTGYLSKVGLRHKTSGTKIVNSVFQRMQVGIMAQWGASGNVIGHNYFTGGYNDTAGAGAHYLTSDVEVGHGAHPQYNLVEGNIGAQFRADNYWGTVSDTTLLGNWWEGYRQTAAPYSARGSPGATNNLTQSNRAIQIFENEVRHSAIGNLLGNKGNWASRSPAPARKKTNPSTSDYDQPYAFHLGYISSSDTGGNTSLTNPSLTLIDHGNFDSITNGIVWDGAIDDRDVPTSLYGATPIFNLTSLPTDWNDITNAAKTWFNDVAPPSPSTSTIASTFVLGTTSFSVTAATSTDALSPPVMYRFSLDNGSTWTAYQIETSYTYTGLSPATGYQVKVQARDSHPTQHLTTASSATTVTTDSPGGGGGGSISPASRPTSGKKTSPSILNLNP